jgi:hypothetical protein
MNRRGRRLSRAPVHLTFERVPYQDSFTVSDLAFHGRYAALRYSLIRPLRTCLRSIRAAIPVLGTQ